MSAARAESIIAASAAQAARPPAEAAERLRVRMVTDPRGVHDFPGSPRVNVAVHFGAAVEVACFRGNESHRGRAVHGDLDIIPRGMCSRWVNEGTDTVFVMSLAPEVMEEAAREAECDAARLSISNRFQARDETIERIAWRLKAEMDRKYPSGVLFLQSMSLRLANELLQRHSSLRAAMRVPNGGMPPRKLKNVIGYIEENLDTDLVLDDIAAVAGMSVSHCKALFRRSVGQPVHQYVIRRRVERAALLLHEGKLPISQIALETGFSHQSHLSRHMRRLLGISPKAWQTALSQANSPLLRAH